MKVKNFGLGLAKLVALSMLPISIAIVAWTPASLAASKFIDASIEDFRAVSWPIDGDLNATNWAQAGRAANEFCKGEGFVGGAMNGHQSGAMRGVLCVPGNDATFIDATLRDLRATGWPIDGDLNATNWAQAGRAANEFCKSKGFLAGWMNGHQSQNMRGVLCVRPQAAQFLDGKLRDFRNVGWSIDGDLNLSNWAQAGRAANEFCKSKGFIGGHMNGHQSGLNRGVICLR